MDSTTMSLERDIEFFNRRLAGHVEILEPAHKKTQNKVVTNGEVCFNATKL
jgi:hypothetical protein